MPLVAADLILEQLRHAIDHAAHLLPAQGPITVFIHHNTLHALEDLPFTEAVKRGATVFGCQPYLTRSRYREELRRGRIQFADLEAVLRESLGAWAEERVLRFGTRLELRLAMLQYPVPFGPTEEVLWFVAEKDALRRIRDDVSAAVRGRLIAETRRWVMRDLRGYGVGQVCNLPSEGRLQTRPTSLPAGSKGKRADLPGLLERFRESRIEEWGEDDWEAFTLQALWRVCCDGAARVPDLALPPLLPVRHRDLLLQVARADADLLVHDVLIRFSGTFLDQGLAPWPLPWRDEGFYQAFCTLYRQPLGPPERWLDGLASELARLQDACVSPLESVRESLELLGVEEVEWHDFLSATLLALRGWAGMVRFLQERGDRAVRPVRADSLVDFLAIRLLLDRLALTHLARETLGFPGPLRALRAELRRRIGPPPQPSPEQRAFVVFQLAQVLGWSPAELHPLSEADWATLLEEIGTFPAIERRRILHLAYERRLYTQTLDALALHNREPHPEPSAPRFQAMFCIDEREESLRRHLEEVTPDAVTFGIAGFYFLPMYYRGAADAHFAPLCPAGVRPKHWVVEEVAETAGEAHRRQARTRRAVQRMSHGLYTASRSFVMGAVLSAVGGVLATVPLIARTLLPRPTARFRRKVSRFVQALRLTRLRLERDEPIAGPEDGHVGFSLAEMTDVAERVLRDTGLTSGFARLVLMFGHGSTSMNNPHESAHDCGACGGSRGGPNGRAIAQVLNDSRVRDRLKPRGLDIPPGTVFVGGMHNTSSEAITFYDLDRLPESHREEFAVVRELVEQAADRDAHERCRRFESAPLTLSFEAARQHVEGRAEDLAQVRPEWGHATNAVCVVGRRRRTRGLFLDRRAFLNSYDPTQDDADATVLTRILQAAVPVCAGINLEYYFSYVDNPGYGCGTKLPHNLAALLGVMDGAASDLRTGLPWQMVEIHEPVRILFVVETWPETMLGIMDRNPDIGRLCRNEWVRLALLDPESAEVQVFRNGAFQRYQPQATDLPRVSSSIEWYRGWRDHLEFAEIAPAGHKPDA
jgi:uncharacterized protein YbcC (UPF0753/DUF2309 family)